MKKSGLKRMLPLFLFLLGMEAFTLSTRAAEGPLLLNGSAETGEKGQPQGWTSWGKGEFIWSDDSAKGKHSLQLSGTQWDTGWSSNEFPVDGSYEKEYPWYTLTAQVKRKDSVGRVYLSIAWYDGKTWLGNTTSEWMDDGGTHDWEDVEVSALPPLTTDHAQVFLRADAEAGTVWFDEIDLKVERFSLKKKIEGSDKDPLIAPLQSFTEEYAGAEKSRCKKGIHTLLATLWASGKGDEDWADLSRFDTADPQDRKEMQRKADRLIQKGKLSEAKQLLESLLAAPVTEDEAFRVKATQCLMLDEGNENDLLISNAKSLVTQYPKHREESLFILGKAECETQDYENAENHLGEAVRLLDNGQSSPLLMSAKTWLGIVYVYKNPLKAIPLLWSVLKKNPFSPDAKLAYGYLFSVLEDAKRTDEMRLLADWADANWPMKDYQGHREMALYQRGRAAELDGNAENATTQYKRLLELYPTSSWAKAASDALAHLIQTGNAQ